MIHNGTRTVITSKFEEKDTQMWVASNGGDELLDGGLNESPWSTGSIVQKKLIGSKRNVDIVLSGSRTEL